MSIYDLDIDGIWDYEDGDETVTLDGYFSIRELKDIIKYMEVKKHERTRE